MFDKMSTIKGTEFKEETDQYWTHISGNSRMEGEIKILPRVRSRSSPTVANMLTIHMVHFKLLYAYTQLQVATC